MPYVPDPTNAAEPLDSEAAGTAAAEFRALKGRVNTLASTIPTQGNLLINGGFMINQRGAGNIAGDTYGHDRWYALTQTAALANSTLTDVENGTLFMARLRQSQTIGQRIGYAQIVEGGMCKHLRGQQVVFRVGRVRASAAINIRMAILEWTGTEDVVTSNVVNDWTSATYTPGNFFSATNLTVSGVIQQTLAANTLTDGTPITVTLGSSFTNLIVFVWTESAVAQNVSLDLARVQLEAASTATSFVYRPRTIESQLCYRYYYALGGGPLGFAGMASSTTFAYCPIVFPVPMRTGAALNAGGTAGSYEIINSNGFVITCSAIPSLINSNTQGAMLGFNTAGSLIPGGVICMLGTGSAILGFPAEL